MWERRIRQTVAPSQPSSEKEATHDRKATENPIEAWMEQWRTANESFMKSIRESGLGEEAVKQTKELRKTFEDSFKSLQKLWQPSSKGNGK